MPPRGRCPREGGAPERTVPPRGRCPREDGDGGPGTTGRFPPWPLRGRGPDSTTRRRHQLSSAARTPRASATMILKPALSVPALGAPGLHPSSDVAAAPAGARVTGGGALLGVLAVGLGGGGPPVPGEALPVPLHQDIQPHRHLRVLDLGDTGHHHGHPAGDRCGHTPPSILQLQSPAARRGAMTTTDVAPAQGRDGRAGSRGAPDATQLGRPPPAQAPPDCGDVLPRPMGPARHPEGQALQARSLTLSPWGPAI